jgi:GAF domain-containing protein
MAESLLVDKNLTDEQKYEALILQLEGLINKDDYLITNLSNFTAALKQVFEKISWVGFYLFDGKELILGPFQGKIACSKIEVGKGVCGTALKEGTTIVVQDVNQFPGHITCDSESRSEIVIPLFKKNKIIGVLDIDSTSYNSFSEIDQMYLERICNFLLTKLELENFIIT